MEVNDPCSLWAVPEEGGPLFGTHALLVCSNNTRPALSGAVFIQHSRASFSYDEALAEQATRRAQVLEAELARIGKEAAEKIESAIKRASTK